MSTVPAGVPSGTDADASLRIRPADDDDATALIALIASCFAEYEGCVLDTQHEMAHLHAVASHFSAAGGVVWVAESKGPVVGSVGCRPGGPEGVLMLQMLYVAAPSRRRGLGSQLVALVEHEATRRRLPTVELWSDTRFTDAHRLYRSLGYEQLPETRQLHDLSHTVEYRFAKQLVL